MTTSTSSNAGTITFARTGSSWIIWNEGIVTTTATSSITDVTITWGAWARESVYSYEATVAAKRERRREAKVLRDGADKRAEELLKQFLAEEQRRQYEREQCFDVLSKDGRRRYRIRHKWAGNIVVLDEQGHEIEQLCIHPRESMPIADSLLAQKLMIETDEELFRKTANITLLRLRAAA